MQVGWVLPPECSAWAQRLHVRAAVHMRRAAANPSACGRAGPGARGATAARPCVGDTPSACRLAVQNRHARHNMHSLPASGRHEPFEAPSRQPFRGFNCSAALPGSSP